MARKGSQGTKPPKPPMDRRRVYIPPDIAVLQNSELNGMISRELTRLRNGHYWDQRTRKSKSK